MSNVPKLRFSEFVDDWICFKLREISSKIGSGSTPRGGSAVYQASGIPFIRSQNVNHNRLNTDDLTFIDEQTHSSMSNSRVKPHDVLLNITGASIGRSCVVPSNFSDGNVNQHVCIIRLKNDFLPQFLQLIIASNRGQKLVFQQQAGGGREGLNFQALGGFKVKIPLLEEQQKIAAFLTAVDTKIEQLTQKEALLKQYKKGVMQKIFSQEIRFKADDGSAFPEWQNNKLSSFMDERRTQAPKNDSYPLMAFIAYKGVAEKGDRYNREFLVNDEDGKKYKRTEYGDFIYSSNNLEVGSIGLNTYGNASISPVYSIFNIKEKFNEKFISNYLVRPEFLNKMTRYRQGVVYGQWRIHEKDFLNIEESIPSWDEQTKIAHFLDAIDNKVSQIASQLEEAKTFKRGLLQQMFV